MGNGEKIGTYENDCPKEVTLPFKVRISRLEHNLKCIDAHPDNQRKTVRLYDIFRNITKRYKENRDLSTKIENIKKRQRQNETSLEQLAQHDIEGYFYN